MPEDRVDPWNQLNCVVKQMLEVVKTSSNSSPSSRINTTQRSRRVRQRRRWQDCPSNARLGFYHLRCSSLAIGVPRRPLDSPASADAAPQQSGRDQPQFSGRYITHRGSGIEPFRARPSTKQLPPARVFAPHRGRFLRLDLDWFDLKASLTLPTPDKTP